MNENLLAAQKEYRAKHRRCKYCAYCDDIMSRGLDTPNFFTRCKITDNKVMFQRKAKRCKYYRLP